MSKVAERRRPYAWKLRIYMDAIRDAEATSDETWLNAWISENYNAPFLHRSVWIEILKSWALIEAEKVSRLEAA